MYTFIITSYHEPLATIKAVHAILSQDIKKPFKIIVADPFIEVKHIIEKEFKGNTLVEFFLDPGEGKAATLNLILEMYYTDHKEDILIFTDGDVFIGQGSIKALISSFKDPRVGVVCGHPVPLNTKDHLFGFWAHLFFDEMNATRKHLSSTQQFFALTGYLFAIRNGIVKTFPLSTNEDKVIPSLFWEQGYGIQYSEDATVYVLNPQNFKDYVTQKKRNIKGRINLKTQSDNVYAKESGFFSESLRGLNILFTYPQSLKEFIWILLAMFARLYVWGLAYYDIYFKKKKYHDGWRIEEVSSTKPLD